VAEASFCPFSGSVHSNPHPPVNTHNQTHACIIRKLRKSRTTIELFTSEITVTECLVGAYKKKNTALIEKYEAFFKSVSEAVNIVPVDSHILWEVPKLAGDSNLKLVDSIHVMSAVFCGCDGFLTNDKAIGSDKLNIMLLSELDD
jgi:predicted nucleic acid-binding protein